MERGLECDSLRFCSSCKETLVLWDSQMAPFVLQHLHCASSVSFYHALEEFTPIQTRSFTAFRSSWDFKACCVFQNSRTEEELAKQRARTEQACQLLKKGNLLAMVGRVVRMCWLHSCWLRINDLLRCIAPAGPTQKCWTHRCFALPSSRFQEQRGSLAVDVVLGLKKCDFAHV